jgi:hypothetical protein
MSNDMSNDNEQKYCFNFEQCDLHVYM